MSKKYNRILVSNRGDSAVRVIRACKELGIETVTIYSKADIGSLHTRLADYAVCIGDSKSSNSYLNSYNIMAIAKEYNVDAIHPGIGFLAESSDFCELCEACNVDFIGPKSSVINKMANKIEAKKFAEKCNVPIVISKSFEYFSDECIEFAGRIGYPVIIKAAYGGGGKGIRVVNKHSELKSSLESCFKEAKAYFGESNVLIEKYIKNAKHIEVQIIADKYGNVIYLGDRECSIQRHNQKLIEEARCSTISDTLRSKLYEGAINICKSIQYEGLGTVEYLVDEDDRIYFIEMNTRLQVEHTITELITGIDLVKEQIRIAQGEALSYLQENIQFNGYAIETRILAEYYNGNLIPDYGEITHFFIPGGLGVRVDVAYESGNVVSLFYDSLLCKICCHGKSKDEALIKMIRCLDELEIRGVRTNKEFLMKILKDKRFKEGDYNTNFLDEINF